MHVNGKEVIIDLPTTIAIERAKIQLLGLPIIVMPDKVSLEPMHKFHRLAADFLLHDDNDSDFVGHE
jgi:hypothetical protein